MASLNKIILVGRLVSNPEIRTTMDAVPMSRFQLSVDRNRYGGAPKEADIIDIVAWRNLAEYASDNLSKGQTALVEGRIQNRSFDTKDGGRRYVTEIVANNIVLMEKKKSSKAPQPAEEAVEEKPAPSAANDDSFLGEDLPF